MNADIFYNLITRIYVTIAHIKIVENKIVFICIGMCTFIQ